MTELMIFLALVTLLTFLGLAVLNALDDTSGQHHRPPQSHADDEFARGARHRDQIR